MHLRLPRTVYTQVMQLMPEHVICNIANYRSRTRLNPNGQVRAVRLHRRKLAPEILKRSNDGPNKPWAVFERSLTCDVYL